MVSLDQNPALSITLNSSVSHSPAVGGFVTPVVSCRSIEIARSSFFSKGGPCNPSPFSLFIQKHMSLENIIQNSVYNHCPPGMSQSVWRALEEQRIAKEAQEPKKKRKRGIKNRGTKVHKDTTKYDRNVVPKDHIEE